MTIKNFKISIEQTLFIIKWDPTDSDLYEIAEKICNLPHPDKRDILRIITDVVGPVKTAFIEGIDNSDIITLLSLAKKVANENK